MRVLFLVFFIFMSSVSGAVESTLVDVDKNSKLSDYFKKINKKVSDNSEEKSLSFPSNQAKPSQAEEEILLREATKNSDAAPEMSPAKKMLVAMLVLLGVVGFLFLTMQKLGRQKGYTKIAQNIKILTQKPVGPKKNLMLIRVAGETILLGVTDHNINHIKTLSLMEDELPEFTEPQFSSQLQNKIQKAQEEPSLLEREPEELDGYAISNLDDVKQAIKGTYL